MEGPSTLSATDKAKRAFKGVWIPKAIWDSNKLTWQEKCLLAEIDSLDNDDGCFAGNPFLAKRFNCTTKRMANQVADLVKRGWLLSSKGKNRALRIAINGKAPPRRDDPALRDIDDPAFRDTTIPHCGIVDPAFRDIGGGSHIKGDTNKVPLEVSADAVPQSQLIGLGHAKFYELWKVEFQKRFEDDYVFQGGKDGAAVKRLLSSSGLNPDELISLAKSAWDHIDRYPCDAAASIAGFASKFNEIRIKVGGRNGSKVLDHKNGWDREAFYEKYVYSDDNQPRQST